MNLTDLRTCDECSGPVGIIFSIVKVHPVIVNAEAVRQAQGGALAHGLPVKLSEVMGVVHDAENAVVVAGVGEKGKETEDFVTEIFLCQNCMTKPIILAALIEKRDDVKEEAETT